MSSFIELFFWLGVRGVPFNPWRTFGTTIMIMVTMMIIKNNGNDDGDGDDDDDDGIEGTDARHIGRAIDFAIASSLSLAVASICLFVAAAPVLASAALFCSCISICRGQFEMSKWYSTLPVDVCFRWLWPSKH